MMAKEPRVNALLLGHSLVRRMQEFITRSSDDRFLDTLNLQETCNISWQGTGGRTVARVHRFDMGVITALRLAILVLELVSNDICYPRRTPLSVARSIMTLVKNAFEEMDVQFIIICQVLHRKNPPLSPYSFYNNNVNKSNRYLKNALQEVTYATLWRHRGLSNPSINIFHDDGIHLNCIGHKALYKSYRGAILYAIRQLHH